MQGPDTDAQDQPPPFTQIRLATHGRSIQLGQSRRSGPMPATSGLPRTTDIIRPAGLVRFVPSPDIQKWITLDPEASIRRAVPSRFSAISLGAHGVLMAILQRCRKRLSELIGDTTAQSGCR
jgi:hypothetical protein